MREPEPTVELHQRWPEGRGAWGQRRDPAVLRSDARPGRAVRDSGSRLIVAIAAGLAFTVGLYGIAANRDLVAAIGLCAVGLTALALKAAAGIRVQALKRRCEMLGRARAKSERARHDLELENAELRRQQRGARVPGSCGQRRLRLGRRAGLRTAPGAPRPGRSRAGRPDRHGARRRARSSRDRAEGAARLCALASPVPTSRAARRAPPRRRTGRRSSSCAST